MENSRIGHIPRPSAALAAPRRLLSLFAACAACLVLVACGGSRDKPATQTAAKVNGDEITVHQINAELARVGGQVPKGADMDAVNKRILEALIDQTLVVQQARSAKLDRDPQVLQALEQARRQILAQAYIERQAVSSPPTPEEVKAFYEKHPDLFQNRKIYAFRDFVFERGSLTDELRNQISGAKLPADIERILNNAGIRFRSGTSNRPAETLPLEALPRIAKLTKGETIAFTDQNLANVMMLMDYTEQSVPLDRATPLIQQYLVNAKRREIAQERVKELRAKATIEYVGAFAKADGEAKRATAPAQPAEAKKDDGMEKGVSGLRR